MHKSPNRSLYYNNRQQTTGKVREHGLATSSYLSSLNPGEGRVDPRSESTIWAAGIPPVTPPMTAAIVVWAWSSSL